MNWKKTFLSSSLALSTMILPMIATISCATNPNDQIVDDVETGAQNLGQKALAQAQLKLQSSLSKYNTVYATEVSYENLNDFEDHDYVLKPKNNFGFTTTVSAPATGGDDLEQGTKKLKLTLSRPDLDPNVKLTSEFVISGFLTPQQYDDETNVESIRIGKQIKWIPTHQVKMHTKQTNLTVRKALEILQNPGTNDLDKLATIIEIVGDGNWDLITGNTTIYSPSLLINQSLDEGVNLVINSVNQVQIDGFATDQIKVIFQLVKGEKQSRYVELLIDGFKHDLAQDTALNLEQYIRIWQTWLNPLRVTPGLTLPLASEITNVSQLLPWLSPGWNEFQNIVMTIDAIEQANDDLGILKVKATFRYDHQPASSAKTTTISIYGFPIDQKPDLPEPEPEVKQLAINAKL